MLNNLLQLKLFQKKQFKKQATGDLTWNKIANKISVNSPKNNLEIDSKTVKKSREISRKLISLLEKYSKLLMI